MDDSSVSMNWVEHMKERGIGKAGAILIFIVGLVIGVVVVGSQPSLSEKVPNFSLSSNEPATNILSNKDGDTDFPILSPSEVRAHPNQYMNDTISIEGTYIGEYIIDSEDYDSGGYTLATAVPLKLPDSANVYHGGEYRFTGVLKEGGMSVGYRLIVGEVKPI